MIELLNWLRSQPGGIQTYYGFQAKALQLREQELENAGLARLLGDLAGRFADSYDGQPLSVDVANLALARLTDLTEKAVKALGASATERLALIDEIAVSELF